MIVSCSFNQIFGESWDCSSFFFYLFYRWAFFKPTVSFLYIYIFLQIPLRYLKNHVSCWQTFQMVLDLYSMQQGCQSRDCLKFLSGWCTQVLVKDWNTGFPKLNQRSLKSSFAAHHPSRPVFTAEIFMSQQGKTAVIILMMSL